MWASPAPTSPSPPPAAPPAELTRTCEPELLLTVTERVKRRAPGCLGEAPPVEVGGVEVRAAPVREAEPLIALRVEALWATILEARATLTA